MQLPTPMSYDTMPAFGWGTDAAGLHTACCLLRLRPADMIKIGELYLGGGVWQGKQILPPGWVEQSTTVSPLGPEYALMWWRMALIPTTDNPTPHDTLIARGERGPADRHRAGPATCGGGRFCTHEGLRRALRRLLPAHRRHPSGLVLGT